MAAARRDVTEQTQHADATQQRPLDGRTDLPGEPVSEVEPPDEKELAMKQWLRQIPDDPAGLLRRKFMVEHLNRMRNAQ